MVLSSGSRLGPYEILAPLGAGGMGEVYEARDTRLDRSVAIKVLPSHVATDPHLKQRFEREAKTLALLSHPHICPVFDVGRQDDIDFLVMEYLDGETLSSRLDKGALPLGQALQYAIQISDALDKAHRKGIVHRDLKPGNVMLNKSGLKLLDFGLAKLLRVDTGTSGSGATTMHGPLTEQGTFLGTPHYMAPEQIEGKETDARSDIFSFGTILYEMVTGKRAFDGTTAASVMAATLEREPPPMSSLQPLAPPLLDHIVKRCLAKDVDARWQSAGDLLDELRWIAAGGGQTGSVLERRGSFSQPVSTLLVVAGMAIVGLSVPAVVHLREEPVSSPEVRLELTPPYTREPLHFALSPDGEHLVFVASGDGAQRLWHRPLSDVSARPLDGTEGAEYPFWSPDSRTVGFFASSRLKRVDIGGGPPQILAAAPNGRGGSWSRDGGILFAPTNTSSLFVVPASGGTPEAVTTLDPPRHGSHRFPQFLPDGRRFLFYAQGSADGRGVYLGSLDGPSATRLTSAETNGAYAEPGLLVFMQQNALVSRRLDLSSGTLTGDLVTIADRVSFDAGFNLAGFSGSAAGRLAYLGGESERRQLKWFDRDGNVLGVVGEQDANDLVGAGIMLSPDGRRIAVARTTQTNQDIWVLDALRGGATRINSDPANENSAAWSPDATRIVFSSNRNGIYDLFLKPSSGAGAEELLFESPYTKIATDWSRDGRFLFYDHGDPRNGWDVGALPMIGERTPLVIVSGPFEERGGQLSPDGRWIAYQSNESGRFEIYVQPFPGAGDKWQVSTGGGVYPRWRPNGEELFFISPDGTLMAAAVRAVGSTLDPGSPEALFKTQMVGGGRANLSPQYAVSPDGRFLFNVSDASSPTPITVIVNWNTGVAP